MEAGRFSQTWKQVSYKETHTGMSALYVYTVCTYHTVCGYIYDMYICTPEAVQIKAPRLTIYPVTAQEVSTREHEQWASGGGGGGGGGDMHITRVICISPRKRMGERQALEPCSSVRRLAG